MAPKFCDQKGPNKIFPMLNFGFSHNGHCGLGGRGGTLLLRLCTAILILP